MAYYLQQCIHREPRDLLFLWLQIFNSNYCKIFRSSLGIYLQEYYCDALRHLLVPLEAPSDLVDILGCLPTTWALAQRFRLKNKDSAGKGRNENTKLNSSHWIVRLGIDMVHELNDIIFSDASWGTKAAFWELSQFTWGSCHGPTIIAFWDLDDEFS